MDITSEWLDEQIRASTEEGDRYMQLAFRCQGVIRMAEHVKARLAESPPAEPIEPEVMDETVPLDEGT